MFEIKKFFGGSTAFFYTTITIPFLSFAGCRIDAFHKTHEGIIRKRNYARFNVTKTVCKRLCELDEKCVGIGITSDSSVVKSDCFLYITDASILRDISRAETFFSAHRMCGRDDKSQRRLKRDPKEMLSKGNL